MNNSMLFDSVNKDSYANTAYNGGKELHCLFHR